MQIRHQNIISKMNEIMKNQGLGGLLKKILSRLKHEIVSLPARLNSDGSERLILDSKLMRPDFYAPHLSITDAAKNYVVTKNASRRKPFPGFHPGIYSELQGLTKSSNPFADYILNGQPNGKWKVDVVTSNTKNFIPHENLRLALHIHVHYPDMLPDILKRLKSNNVKPDLYITITSSDIEKEVKSILEGTNLIFKTFIVPNKGRDIAPFVVYVGKELVQNYEYIGHIHTKKSLQFHNSVGKDWHNFLIENVLGSDNNKMMDAIIEYFESKDSISLIFPDDPNTCGWDSNRLLCEGFAKKLNLEDLPNSFNFPIGSMFWIRSRALTPLVELGLTIDDFVDEPLPHDGTIGHAIERIISFLPEKNNDKYAVTNTPGVTR